MGSDPPAIAVKGLSVRRGGRVVLHGVDLHVGHGEVVGLLGPSGHGKSTLMRAVVGVQNVAGGEVTVLGRPAGHPWLRSRVAYMTQALSIYRDLTVRQNLRYYGRLLGVDGQGVQAALDAVALTASADRAVGRLSGGQQARASLAVALLGRPRVLILDEPTVGQDPVLREELWARFHALKAAGAALLVSSHVMDEAARCDRLVLVRDGRVLAAGTPQALREATGEDDMERVFLALVTGAGTISGAVTGAVTGPERTWTATGSPDRGDTGQNSGLDARREVGRNTDPNKNTGSVDDVTMSSEIPGAGQ